VFPGKGATKHLALLLLEQLAGLARDGGHTLGLVDHAERADDPDVWRIIPDVAVRATASDVLQRWREGLRRDQREDPESAVREALDLLCQLGLLRQSHDAGSWAVHAAAARYATHTTLAEASDSGERSLFDRDQEDQ